MRRCLLILAIAFFAVVERTGAGAIGNSHPDSALVSRSFADLADGDTLTSNNGEFVFSDFEGIASGLVGPGVQQPQSDYDRSDRFMIVGPIAAEDGDSGSLSIEYTVTSASPTTQARLKFNGHANGEGSSASWSD